MSASSPRTRLNLLGGSPVLRRSLIGSYCSLWDARYMVYPKPGRSFEPFDHKPCVRNTVLNAVLRLNAVLHDECSAS